MSALIFDKKLREEIDKEVQSRERHPWKCPISAIMRFRKNDFVYNSYEFYKIAEERGIEVREIKMKQRGLEHVEFYLPINDKEELMKELEGLPQVVACLIPDEIV